MSIESLVGLGLPLTLRPDGVTLHIQGPYGTHALTLKGGVTDLGDAFAAPSFAALKFSTSGPHILLADVLRGAQEMMQALNAVKALGKATQDEAKRKQIYTQISKHLEDNAVWIWLFTSFNYTATNSSVQGFTPMANGSLQSLKTTTVN